MRVWLGDRLVEQEEAKVSVFDHGLTVGDGVFETLKAVDGRLFALPEHIDRLTRSARMLGLPDPDAELVDQACRAVMAEPEVDGLMRVRVTYTAGPGPLGSDRGTAGTTLVVAASPVPERSATVGLAVVPWPRNERGALSGVKSTSYAENAKALAWAKDRGAGEALFANSRGLLCEGTGSNVFVVVGGSLRTPDLRSGCLDGITRRFVLEWVPDAAEEDLPLGVLEVADEVFITSSTRDIHPVSAVDGRALEAPGPITAQAIQEWERRSPERYTD